jgi:hypothetical protein
MNRNYVIAMTCMALAAILGVASCTDRQPPAPVPQPKTPSDIEQQTISFCGSCHKVPPADTFPRSAWKGQVEQGFSFFERSGKSFTRMPPIEAVIKYYEDQAPEKLPPAEITYADHPYPVQFEHLSPKGPGVSRPHAISNVNLVHLFDEKQFDILACDMRNGHIMACQPYLKDPTWRVLGTVSNPAHVEVVDLDGDGIKDILVADLGSFPPTDQACGKVVWLRGMKDGTFTPITLLDKVGRVADVQAADFRGTGKLDLVVAEFGWQSLGKILLLENHTTDWNKPEFVKRVIDERHGAIHVPVADLDGDGRPDFVALISQEFETVVAFLNRGNGNFEKKELWTAPHPGYGSSGIQLVDLNQDGKLDVLYTNGDVLDIPYLLKPYHGIQWLENKGNLKFEHHWLAPMYGVHRAVAADFRGCGKLDIFAVCFLPIEGFPKRREQKFDAIIMLEQTESGKFVRHQLASGICDHVTCVAGDIFGTGKPSVVVGNYNSETEPETPAPVTIWRNQGAAKKP